MTNQQPNTGSALSGRFLEVFNEAVARHGGVEHLILRYKQLIEEQTGSTLVRTGVGQPGDPSAKCTNMNKTKAALWSRPDNYSRSGLPGRTDRSWNRPNISVTGSKRGKPASMDAVQTARASAPIASCANSRNFPSRLRE